MNAKKICSLIILIILILNSSLLTIISEAVEDVKVTLENEKISMDLSYTQLTNKVQNRLIITGTIQEVYENPVIYFEMPKEVEEVKIDKDEIDVFFYEGENEENETVKECTVSVNEAGNKVVKLELNVTTKADETTNGTTIRMPISIILKQNIETTSGQIKMTCGENTCSREVKLVNFAEVLATNTIDKMEGTKQQANGLLIETKSIVGDTLLKNQDAVYENEIIKYEVKLTNTTDAPIDNIKLLGNIPDGMTYVDYNEEGFSYWAETYTPLETDNADAYGVYWQDDTYQYKADENIKTKEIEIEQIKAGETKTYYYEAKVNKIEEEKNINTKIELSIKDEIVNTYNITHIVKKGEFEVRIRQYASRTAKDEWTYHVIAKNLTNEDKDANITIEVPQTLEIEKIVSYESNEQVEYEIENGILKIKCGSIKANYFKAFIISTKVINIEETKDCLYEIKFGANVQSNNTYRSNQCVTTGGIEAIQITQSSETNGEKIRELKEITYEYEITNIGHVADEWGGYSSIVFEDNIPNELAIREVEYSNYSVKEIPNSKRRYTITLEQNKFSSIEVAQANGRDNSETARIKLDLNIKVGETIKIRIKTRTRSLDKEKDNVLIENFATVSGEYIKTKQSNIIQNTIYRPSTTNVVTIDSNGNVVEDPSKPVNPDNPTTETKKYTISGVAWIDENEDGIRGNNEKVKSGIEVLVLNVEKNEFLTDNSGNIIKRTTNNKGEYSFVNVPKGKYYVIFLYDSNEYNITEYKKQGASETINCDVISKKARIFGEVKQVGITNTIELNSNKTNIDIGLTENKIFDLKIDQFVQKVTVTNSKGTKVYNYDNKKLAKFEIHSKQFVGSTVAIEYKIVVTNVGELAGTINEIIDQIPSGLEFHSELNNNWSKSMTNNASNTSFTTQEIKPGESIETTIVLTKTLNDKSAGTLTNITKIGISDNTKHIEDSNSENDTSTTEVIIGISTGVKTMFKIIGGIMAVLVLALIIFIIMKKLLKKKTVIALFFGAIFAISMMSYSPKVEAYSVEGTIADLQAAVDGAIASGYANATAASAANPNVSVQMVGYNPNCPGSGIFIVMDQSGNIVGSGTCGESGAYFHTHYDEKPIYGDDGEITGTELIEIQASSTSHPVACHYGGTTDPVIESISITVSGDDFPEDGVLLWEGQGIELGQDFSIGGNVPSSFTGAQASAVWNAVASAIDTSDLSSYELDAIKTELGRNGINGSCTAELIQGSAGATSLSVTVSRTVVFTITYSVSWKTIYYVDEDYVCSVCGATVGAKHNQPIEVPGGMSDSIEHTETYSTTVTFEPEDLPKSLTIFKYDEETGELLYDPATCESEFRFLVVGDGGSWEVGVGETITGLHAGVYSIYEIDSAYGYGVWNDNYDTSKGYKKMYDYVIGQSDIVCICNIGNKKEFIDLSGYVWEDDFTSKDHKRNGLYANDEYDNNDKLLPGVKVTLYDTVRGKSFSTWTDENGHYKFGGRNKDLSYTEDTLRLKDLDKYYIEFEYNGVKYRNVSLNIDPAVTNGSRGSEEIASGKDNEDSSMRKNFNERFTVIDEGQKMNANGESTGTVKDKNGQINSDTISYNRSRENASAINYGKNMVAQGYSQGNPEAYGENIYHISATTKENMNFDNYLEKWIEINNTTIVHVTEITGINLGLYVREQVDLGLDSDVKQFDLSVNNYHHIYEYGPVSLVNPDAEEEMGVKLKELKGKYYSRDLHESTIVYSKDADGTNTKNGDVYAEITYKIYLQNKSSSLSATINELTLNYDSRFECISFNDEDGNKIDVKGQEKDLTGGKTLTGEEATTAEAGLKEIVLDLTKLPFKILNAASRNTIEVTFRVEAGTIASILNTTEGIKFDFMAEIKSYTTYSKNEEQIKNPNIDNPNGDSLYASIDSNSAARNAQVETDEAGKFVTDTFENDTTMAPTFTLTKGINTKITGTVFEDKALAEKLNANERIGDGIYNRDEAVMGGVKVELLKVPTTANSNFDANSETVKNSESQKHNYEIAKLYKANNNSEQKTEIGDAITHTNEQGYYEFEGVVSDDYVIKYTYGENIKYVDKDGNEITISTAIYDKNGTKLKDIKAREYKSTIITSPYIEKAINTNPDGIPHLNGDWQEGNTEQSWFLRHQNGDETTRYSDAVDDVEYRAKLEENAKLNNANINNSSNYAYTEMEAYTPFFRLGVEVKDDNVSNTKFNDTDHNTRIETDGEGGIKTVIVKGEITAGDSTIENIDFGIIERPIIDLTVDKQITNVKMTLGNGQVPIDGNPTTEDLPYVKRLDDFVPIEMDTEIIVGATIKQQYTISVKNNSELDYPIFEIVPGTNVATERNYYYYGRPGTVKGTEKVDVLVDYLSPELDINLEEMKNNGWKLVEVKDITEYVEGDKQYRLIAQDENQNKDIETKLTKGNYKIFTTNVFGESNNLIQIGETQSISYEVSRLLTSKDEMEYTNDVEILQYLGYSQNKDKTENSYNRINDTTPGNLLPEYAKEDDEDSVRTTITPPTGVIISKTLYITTAMTGLVIILLGILWIKKRIL